MITIVIVLTEILIQAFTFAPSVHVLAGVTRETEEWYGSKCYWRPIELQIDGALPSLSSHRICGACCEVRMSRWYEAAARRCP